MPPAKDNSTPSIAEVAKEKGNEAFRSQEYRLAISLYTHAMRIDADNHIYPLNRSMAYIKLEKWNDAIADASKVLEMSPFNLKALLRRSRAHKALGHWTDARMDIKSFIAHGGNSNDGAQELEKIQHAQSSARLPTPPSELDQAIANLCLADSDPSSSSDPLFVVRKSTAISDGVGAFATRSINRGDMILSELPAFSIPQCPLEPAKFSLVETAVRQLGPSTLNQYLSLYNSHSDCTCFSSTSIVLGIYSTNAFMLRYDDTGICIQTSRFNHSCSPNARYSFDDRSGRMRIHALTEIHPGSEIFVSYIAGRGVYGTPTRRRQAVLSERYHFTCTCTVCSLPDVERQASDRRRTELTALWNTIPRFTPAQGAERLRVIVHAVSLLRDEEGYHADADDYTNDAGVVCAFHGDWESARYWAEVTYRITKEEFGEGSGRAEEVRGAVEDPRSLPLAGMGPPRKFTHIRLRR